MSVGIRNCAKPKPKQLPLEETEPLTGPAKNWAQVALKNPRRNHTRLLSYIAHRQFLPGGVLLLCVCV
jgi:hypothetical protein